MPDLGGPLVLPEEGDDHADQDGEHRAAHHLEPLSQQPGGHGDHQADQDARAFFLTNSMICVPFSLVYSRCIISRRKGFVKEVRLKEERDTPPSEGASLIL